MECNAKHMTPFSSEPNRKYANNPSETAKNGAPFSSERQAARDAIECRSKKCTSPSGSLRIYANGPSETLGKNGTLLGRRASGQRGQRAQSETTCTLLERNASNVCKHSKRNVRKRFHTSQTKRQRPAKPASAERNKNPLEPTASQICQYSKRNVRTNSSIFRAKHKRSARPAHAKRTPAHISRAERFENARPV